MRKIDRPDLKSATTLKAADMNRIHFGGNHTPLTAKALLAADCAGDNGKEDIQNGTGDSNT